MMFYEIVFAESHILRTGCGLSEAFLKLPPEKGEPCLSRHSVL